MHTASVKWDLCVGGHVYFLIHVMTWVKRTDPCLESKQQAVKSSAIVLHKS